MRNDSAKVMEQKHERGNRRTLVVAVLRRPGHLPPDFPPRHQEKYNMLEKKDYLSILAARAILEHVASA